MEAGSWGLDLLFSLTLYCEHLPISTHIYGRHYFEWIYHMPVFQDSIDRRLDCFQFFLIAFAYNSVTNTVIFFFLIVLGLHCCVRAFSSCGE